MIFRLATLVLLAQPLGCSGTAYFPDTEIAERVGPSKIAVYTAANTIKSYQVEYDYMVNVDGVPLKEWPHGFLGEFVPIEKPGPALNSDQRSRLLSILGSAETYDLDNSEKCECCYIQPEYGFEFISDNSREFVFVGLRCRQVYFLGGEFDSELLSTKSTATDLSDLLVGLFSSAGRD